MQEQGQEAQGQVFGRQLSANGRDLNRMGRGGWATAAGGVGYSCRQAGKTRQHSPAE
eukprot:SAG22_NODE_17116_length_311_cov_0.731132_1_plen_56_part_01